MLDLIELQKQFPDLTLVKGDRVQASGLKDIGSAEPEEATFFVNDRYRSSLTKSRAGVLIAHTEQFPFVVEEFAGSIWHTQNPLPVLHVIGQRLEHLLFSEDETWREPGVHPTAVVEEGVSVHPEATVGPYCVLRRGSKIEHGAVLMAYVYVGCKAWIGPGCWVGPHVSILAHSEVGHGSQIMAGAVIGSKGFSVVRDHRGHNVNLPQLGKTVLGKQVRIGCNATVDRATFGETRLGDRSALDNLTQVGHNAQTDEDFIMCALSGLTGSTRLGKRVTIAAHSGTKEHVTVTDDVTVAAQSGITKDITTPHITLKGSSGLTLQEYLKQQVMMRKLPDLFKRISMLESQLCQLQSRDKDHD
jgi:UDP-3-O-[3-hydroxymyristoyl] glucosamine N-acyltransferase